VSTAIGDRGLLGRGRDRALPGRESRFYLTRETGTFTRRMGAFSEMDRGPGIVDTHPHRGNGTGSV